MIEAEVKRTGVHVQKSVISIIWLIICYFVCHMLEVKVFVFMCTAIVCKRTFA